jgi:hypothetical protein
MLLLGGTRNVTVTRLRAPAAVRHVGVSATLYTPELGPSPEGDDEDQEP